MEAIVLNEAGSIDKLIYQAIEKPAVKAGEVLIKVKAIGVRGRSMPALRRAASDLLNEYFDRNTIRKNGLPTVAYVAEQLNISSHYLSGVLRSVTGLNTQQHIHLKLIEKAKELLSTTHLTVSEIAYILGFEQMQSFSKLFKAKTNVSPLEFRESFN